MSAYNGFFITFEGIDRCGKSTQAKILAEALGGGTLAVREPGATDVGERIRKILLDRATKLEPIAEAALYAAARAQLVEETIRPALAAGRTVICDRYIDSSLAYQGAARGLGEERVRKLNENVTCGLWPDLTLLIVVSPDVVAGRDGESDRLEQEGADFQEKVATAYMGLARKSPERIVCVDGARSVEEVHAEVLEVVGKRVKEGAKCR